LRRRILIAIIALAAWGGAAAPARSADVSFQEFVNRVTVTAKNGEVNRIRVSVTPSEVRITDTGAPLVDLAPGEPTCKSLSGSVITCDRIATETMRMQMRDGNDRIEFREEGDDLEQPFAFFARGGTGNDVLIAITPAVERDLVLRGEAGNDQLFGAAGNDLLEGGTGADALSGRAGKDRLDGGTGPDTFLGGSGADTLLAKDGARDKKLNCGTGVDSLSRDARLDPVPISC
jgi:RTX calcium-binding nonapeptide repeat (4 copies)